MKCIYLVSSGRSCGNYAIRGDRRCFWHIAPGNREWDTRRRAARSKGARVMHSQRAVRAGRRPEGGDLLTDFRALLQALKHLR